MSENGTSLLADIIDHGFEIKYHILKFNAFGHDFSVLQFYFRTNGFFLPTQAIAWDGGWDAFLVLSWSTGHLYSGVSEKFNLVEARSGDEKGLGTARSSISVRE